MFQEEIGRINNYYEGRERNTKLNDQLYYNSFIHLQF